MGRIVRYHTGAYVRVQASLALYRLLMVRARTVCTKVHSTVHMFLESLEFQHTGLSQKSRTDHGEREASRTFGADNNVPLMAPQPGFICLSIMIVTSICQRAVVGCVECLWLGWVFYPRFSGFCHVFGLVGSSFSWWGHTRSWDVGKG